MFAGLSVKLPEKEKKNGEENEAQEEKDCLDTSKTEGGGLLVDVDVLSEGGAVSTHSPLDDADGYGRRNLRPDAAAAAEGAEGGASIDEEEDDDGLVIVIGDDSRENYLCADDWDNDDMSHPAAKKENPLWRAMKDKQKKREARAATGADAVQSLPQPATGSDENPMNGPALFSGLTVFDRSSKSEGKVVHALATSDARSPASPQGAPQDRAPVSSVPSSPSTPSPASAPNMSVSVRSQPPASSAPSQVFRNRVGISFVSPVKPDPPEPRHEDASPAKSSSIGGSTHPVTPVTHGECQQSPERKDECPADDHSSPQEHKANQDDDPAENEENSAAEGASGVDDDQEAKHCTEEQTDPRSEECTRGDQEASSEQSSEGEGESLGETEDVDCKEQEESRAEEGAGDEDISPLNAEYESVLERELEKSLKSLNEIQRTNLRAVTDSGEKLNRIDTELHTCKEKLESLREKQQESVANEQYEEAASLEMEAKDWQSKIDLLEHDICETLIQYSNYHDALLQATQKRESLHRSRISALKEARDLRERALLEMQEKWRSRMEAQETHYALTWKQLDAQEARCRAAQDQHAKAQHTMEEVTRALEEKLHPFNEGIRRVNAKRDLVREEIKELEARLAKKRQEEQELGKQIGGLQADVTRVKQGAHSSVVEARKELNDAQWKLDEITRRREQCSRTNEELKRERETGSERARELEASITAADDTVKQISTALSAELTSTRGWCERSEQRSAALHVWREHLQDLLREKTRATDLWSGIHALSSQMVELEDACLALRHELETYKQVIPVLEQSKKLAVAGHNYAEASKQAKEIERTKQRRTAVQKELEETEQKKSHLQKTLDNANVEAKECEERVKQMDGDTTKLRNVSWSEQIQELRTIGEVFAVFGSFDHAEQVEDLAKLLSRASTE